MDKDGSGPHRSLWHLPAESEDHGNSHVSRWKQRTSFRYNNSQYNSLWNSQYGGIGRKCCPFCKWSTSTHINFNKCSDQPERCQGQLYAEDYSASQWDSDGDSSSRWQLDWKLQKKCGINNVRRKTNGSSFQWLWCENNHDYLFIERC